MSHDHLFLLHGALGSEEQLQPLQELLFKDFNVHTLNFEGHGGTSSDRAFDMNYFAENVLEKIETLNISKTHIFGYSMGGYVALTLAKKHPEVIDKIVTLGTKFDWTLETAQREVKMLNPKVIEEKVPAFAERLNTLHQPNDWKKVMQKTADMMLSLANGKKLTDAALQHIEHSVLIGIGSLDNMVTEAESQHAANQLPNGSLRLLSDVKHPIEKVDMQLLATTIREFLKPTTSE